MSDYGVIPPSVPTYPADRNGLGLPKEVHTVAAPPVVVINPPELSNVLHQLAVMLDKIHRLLESEVWDRSMPGECVEVMEFEHDEQGRITSVTKRKEYR